MNIVITSFNNPFSFYCIIDNDSENVSLTNNIESSDIANKSKSDLQDVQHGQIQIHYHVFIPNGVDRAKGGKAQATFSVMVGMKVEKGNNNSDVVIAREEKQLYVAVMWKNKWARGIVSMEWQFLIWLVDYGIYLRPDEKTVYVDLPAVYKKLPTKVFEASIHGVTPIDKVLNSGCQIVNQCSREWTKGAIHKAQELIANAKQLYFIPIAMMTTDNNDIVLGDLYIQKNGKKFVNIIDELQLWPVFLEKNEEMYIQNLPHHYTSRRRHRANQLKPHLSNIELPTISINATLDYYKKVCERALPFDNASASNSSECNTHMVDGSTVIGYGGNYKKEKKAFKLTPTEIEKYCNMYVAVHGREYNVLNVLINKIRDLNICERYKDHDLKSMGRGITHRPLN